jgi:RHS repeat-associated protein
MSDYVSNCPSTYKFAGKERDFESGLDNSVARYYASLNARFISPDPSGGHRSDPQTLNKYAYARNNPLNLTDPTGLDPCPDNTADNIDNENCGDEWLFTQSAANLAADKANAKNQAAISALRSFAASAEENLTRAADSYSPFDYEFSGFLYGHAYNMVFNTWDAYAGWRTGIAASPDSQTYQVFSAIAGNLALDPNAAYSVTSQYNASVYTVTVQGYLVNPSNLGGGWWADPLTFLHDGNSSWYQGYFFNTPHLIATDPVSAHVDPFGPLNPLHYLIQLPSMLLPSGTKMNGSCAINGGCTLQ